MKKQFPWITVISAAALLSIAVFTMELNLLLLGLGCLVALFIGELIGCIKANKTGNLFAPNKSALIASLILLFPIVGAVIYDLVIVDTWRWLLTYLAMLVFGTAAGVSLAANLLNFLYKKHKIKQEQINKQFPQRTRPPRIQLKPLIPWAIALAVVMVVLVVINEIMLDHHIEDVLLAVISTIYWLLLAQLLGLIFNQVLGLDFINYIIMLGWLVYSIGESVRLIEYYGESTGFNASYVDWMISLHTGQLIAYSVLAAAALGVLIAAVVHQFKKPKWRKKT